jgi:hypothetical protein
MNKEQLAKLAEALEQAGYKIEALNRMDQDFSGRWSLEISPVHPFESKN